MGSASPQNAPYQAFETKDSYVTVGTGNEEIWKKFCEALGLEHLLDNPNYKDNALRVKHYKELSDEITPTIRQYSTEECLCIFAEAGIPAGPIYNIKEVLEDPHVKSRNILTEFEHPKAGTIKNIGFPVAFSSINTSITSPPPLLGEHSAELMEEVGYSAGQIKDFEQRNIIRTTNHTE
jgi:crotonobetainyl-CoA:carnitine CoA-transferase CaiB-like acyl-CoA transferase